jgi:dienelactone hydrolase
LEETLRASSITSLCTLFILAASLSASAQPAQLKLWPNGAPGSDAPAVAETMRITPEGEHVITHVAEPTITPYMPAPGTATGAAVIVVPGGGHSEIWIDHEGYAVAEWLSNHGVAAFILKYRLAREKDSHYTVEGTELGDLQRAIRVVRSRSAEWGVAPDRVGVMGFSAGGELAILASTRYDPGLKSSPDPIERFSSRPDFQAPLYPAIPSDPRLTPDTPRAFLACGANDRPAISQGLAELYLALTRLHVSTELHIYAGIGHGFGIRKTNPEPVADWPTLFLQWMNAQGLLKR